MLSFLIGVILTIGIYEYKSMADVDSYRNFAAVCNDNPKRYSGYLHSDGVTNRCFRQSSQYPYRINQFVLVGEFK